MKKIRKPVPETSPAETSSAHRLSPVALSDFQISVTPQTAVEVADWVTSRDRKSLLLNHNLHSTYLAQTNSDFKRLYDEYASMVIIDGAPILWLANRRCKGQLTSRHRVGSTDWISELVNSSDGKRIAILGATEHANRLAVDKLSARLGSTWDVHGLDGFQPWQEAVKWLNEIRPDIVLVGLGMPLQEKFLLDNFDDLPEATYATVGGAIDYLAETNQLAPRWVGTLGVEWLWRLAHEPRRLAFRYLIEPLLLTRSVLRQRATRRVDNKKLRSLSARRVRTIDQRRKVLALVTQLERAGAQSVAAWLERSDHPDLDLKTRFLYDKSGSDLFDSKRAYLTKRTLNPFLLLRAGVRLRSEAAQSEAVIAHTHFSILAATIVVQSLRRRPRLVAVHHWPVDRYPDVARGILNLARRRRWIDLEVFVSSAIQDSDGLVIPNPVPKVTSGRNAEGDSPDLLIVARHAQEKGIDVAIRAMQSLPGRSLRLIGQGPETQTLANLAAELQVQDRVHFVGPLSNSEVRAQMSAARAVVLPSRWEAMPMVLLEAVACDAPIIVSDIPAHDFLIEKNAAVAFRAEDPTSLSDKVASLEEELQHLAEGRKRVRAEQSEEELLVIWQSKVFTSSQAEHPTGGRA